MPAQHPDNLQMFQPTRAPVWLFALVAAAFLLLGLQQGHASVAPQNPWQYAMGELHTPNSLNDSSLGLYQHRDTPAPRSAEQNQSPSPQSAAVNGPQTLPVVPHHPLSNTLDPVAPGSPHGRSQQVRAPPML